jgi:hypothetical protein
LQGTNGHANQLGDLLSALSSLDEIPDLLESFRSKLYQPSTSRELRGKPLRLQHLFILSAHCCRCLVSLRGRQTCHGEEYLSSGAEQVAGNRPFSQLARFPRKRVRNLP